MDLRESSGRREIPLRCVTRWPLPTVPTAGELFPLVCTTQANVWIGSGGKTVRWTHSERNEFLREVPIQGLEPGETVANNQACYRALRGFNRTANTLLANLRTSLWQFRRWRLLVVNLTLEVARILDCRDKPLALSPDGTRFVTKGPFDSRETVLRGRVDPIALSCIFEDGLEMIEDDGSALTVIEDDGAVWFQMPAAGKVGLWESPSRVAERNNTQSSGPRADRPRRPYRQVLNVSGYVWLDATYRKVFAQGKQTLSTWTFDNLRNGFNSHHQAFSVVVKSWLRGPFRQIGLTARKRLIIR